MGWPVTVRGSQSEAVKNKSDPRVCLCKAPSPVSPHCLIQKNCIVDAIKDLLPAHLHVEAAQHLKAARKIIKEAGDATSKEKQIELITRAIKQHLAAKELMVESS